MKYFYLALSITALIWISFFVMNAYSVPVNIDGMTGISFGVWLMALFILFDKSIRRQQAELRAIKYALMVFRNIAADVNIAKSGKAIISKSAWFQLVQVLVATRDINCLPGKKKRKGKKL